MQGWGKRLHGVKIKENLLPGIIIFNGLSIYCLTKISRPQCNYFFPVASYIQNPNAMKRKLLICIPALLISLIALGPLCSFNAGLDKNKSAMGQASSCGSPGEPGTCSRSGCHGAGSGGLADNGGPGSLTITAVPAISGNNYVPGQLYHMTVTVNESGKAHYGFGCEILDNSGNTNTHTNNTAGTITVTDAANTTTWQAYGTGRLAITQNSSGGYSSNTASFIFDWTAPSSGIVNIYLCGNATNNDGSADAPDNIYSLNRQLSPLATGIVEQETEAISMHAYPVPAHDVLYLSFKTNEDGRLLVNLYSIDGLLIRTLENKGIEAGPYNQSYTIGDLPKGTYVIRMEVGNATHSKLIMIQ
jgi:hypothetical protein